MTTQTDRQFMPTRNPLGMPQQDLRNPYRDTDAPAWRNSSGNWLSRLVTFGAAFLTTGLLLAAFTDWLAMGGLGLLEFFLIVLVGLTFFWISLSVSTATTGLASFWARKRAANQNPQTVGAPIDVALLIPIYNESPSDVFGNAAAMLKELSFTDSRHRFHCSS